MLKLNGKKILLSLPESFCLSKSVGFSLDFQVKKSLAFPVNRLLADNSQEMPSLIRFLMAAIKCENVICFTFLVNFYRRTFADNRYLLLIVMMYT